MLSYMADEKPEELLRLTLLRARFCEQVGSFMDKGKEFTSSCYTVGMFSLLDVLLGQSMAVILKELNLSQDIVDTLTGAKKTKMLPILRLAKAYEKGDWQTVTLMAGGAKRIFEKLPVFYENALVEVQNFFAAA